MTLYNKRIKVHVLEAVQKQKSNKQQIPQSVSDFARASNFDKKNIHVLIVNTGMINSKTMRKTIDSNLFDEVSTPFGMVSNTKPFVFIDEPHRFRRSNATFKNLLRFNPQCIIRYGATFPGEKNNKDYENLLYDLDSVEAFNQDLVKGIVVHTPKSGKRDGVKITLTNIYEKVANFQLIEKGKNDHIRTYSLEAGDSLGRVHPEIRDLFIENISAKTVGLSNGNILEKGMSLNPYSFSESYQEILIAKAIDEHFKKEKAYFERVPRIKPLTLFFIDQVDSFRLEEGYIRKIFENKLKEKVKEILQNHEISEEYRDYLTKTYYADIDTVGGGYFSKDNTVKDEKIRKQIEEILRDKEKLLSYNSSSEEWNLRRFIFSKWTLKEGWDNPNVFTICKLRSSGSENMKLQEVGRGLRLPVNEHFNREQNTSLEDFELSYIVDFTEKHFADRLVSEINEGSVDDTTMVITKEHLKKMAEIVGLSEEEMFDKLRSEGFIDFKMNLNSDKAEELKSTYAEVFNTLKNDKVRKGGEEKAKTSIRVENYNKFKEIWESINQSVFIKYSFDSEKHVQDWIVEILSNGVEQKDSVIFSSQTVVEQEEGYGLEEGLNQEIISNEKVPYYQFLDLVSSATSIPYPSIHKALVRYNQKNQIDSSTFFTRKTTENLSRKINKKLSKESFEKIQYHKYNSNIHPTALTDMQGNVKNEIPAHNVGVYNEVNTPQENYLYEDLYFDSPLEKNNILEDVDSVIVFGKIPKNSIRIPMIHGRTYSPDFAYIVKKKDGKSKLNLVIETKDVEDNSELRGKEIENVKLGQRFFDIINDTNLEIEFETQYKEDSIFKIVSQFVK